ncbi:MAG: hypothetical protein K8T91_07995 [Planctomycetes bacterium]|nr:hypothetical protein [Planctomycetota bacterium]
MSQAEPSPAIANPRRSYGPGFAGKYLRTAPRFSILTLLVVITAASVLCGLNVRKRTTWTKPYYAGTPHPPPYILKEMTITFYEDRGWPIWHTRAETNYAAHNAALYWLNDEQMGSHDLPVTDTARAVVDVLIGLAILVAVGIASELLIRRLIAVRKGNREGQPSGTGARQEADA